MIKLILSESIGTSPLKVPWKHVRHLSTGDAAIHPLSQGRGLLAKLVKYRRQIFTNELIINRLKEINYDIAEKFGVKILNQETDRDHVHILFSTSPTCDQIKFINSLKGVSSRLLRKEIPVIKHQLWRGVLWSPSYFLCTTGQVTLD